jgi:glycosyltransferase involved in cell wall biosynthesis/SAM-dependent methyltransferase
VQFVGHDNPNDVSGVNTWLQLLVPALRELGIDARVDLFCREPGPNVEWFTKHGVPVRWASTSVDTRLKVRQCLRWLRADVPAIYVPSCILPAYFAAAEARRCGARTIGVLHSDEPFYWGLVDEFVAGDERWRLTDMVAVSEYLKGMVEKSAPPDVAVHGIPYGVQIPGSTAKRDSRPIRLIYTGRLVEEQKRISEVTRAFCAAAREHAGMEAWIVGSGAAEGDVRRIIESEGMQGRVMLKGCARPSEMYGLLQQCHIHVLLSDYEGLPVSMLEAMATGLVPVCLNMRSGLRDVLRHGENGLIVSDRDRSFRDAVSLLIGDAAAWRRMAAVARQSIVERYSVQSCVGHWAELLKQDTGRRSLNGRPTRMIKLPPPNPRMADRDLRFSLLMNLAIIAIRAARFARNRVVRLLGGLLRPPLRFQPLERELEPVLQYLRGRVLNAGCGDRDISGFLGSHGAAGVDNCDIKSAIPGAITCDLSSIPLPDAGYDSILNNAVLEHVQLADEVMREMRRLLKPGGHLVLVVPFLQPYHASPTDYRRYTHEGLRELARVHGFEVVALLPVHSIAQTLTWIIWECLSEKRARLLQAMLWLPLSLWNMVSSRTDPALQRNASAFQIVMRKPVA